MPRASSHLVVISALAFACSAESTAPPPTDGGAFDADPPGVCSGFLRPDNSRCGYVSYAAVCNTERRPRNDAGPCSCGWANDIPCRYVRDPDAGVQRNVIRFNEETAPPSFILRFREPIEGLPVGRVLTMNVDFTVERLSDFDYFGSDYDRRFTLARGSVAGELTVTIQGPPRHASPTPRMAPTMPTLRVVGTLCAAPISTRIAATTIQADP